MPTPRHIKTYIKSVRKKSQPTREPVCSVCRKPMTCTERRMAHPRCLDIKGRMIRHNAEYFAELRAMSCNRFLTDEEIFDRYIS